VHAVADERGVGRVVLVEGRDEGRADARQAQRDRARAGGGPDRRGPGARGDPPALAEVERTPRTDHLGRGLVGRAVGAGGGARGEVAGGALDGDGAAGGSRGALRRRVSGGRAVRRS
jgi:hypothetical protein